MKRPHLKKDNHILVVTHEGLDFDNVCGTSALCRAFEIKQDDPRLHLKFVPSGQQYTGPTDKYAFVFHIDTGGEYDPQNGKFDHHLDPPSDTTVQEEQDEDPEFYCATEMVTEYYWDEDDLLPNDLAIIRDLAITTDTAGRIGGDDPNVVELMAYYNKLLFGLKPELEEHDHPPLICIFNKPGPKDLGLLIYNLDWPDEKLMRFCLQYLEAWYESWTTEQRMNEELRWYLTDCLKDYKEKTINGARVLVTERCSYPSKRIRHYVRRYHRRGRNRKDIAIIQYLHQSYEYAFTIFLVDTFSHVQGMVDLFNALKKEKKRGEGNIFMHEKAILHIPRPTHLTLDDVIAMVEKYLHMSDHQPPSN